MAVRSCVLANGGVAASASGGATTTMYTCPAGKTAIIKEMVVELVSGSGSPHLEVGHVGGVSVRVWSPGFTAVGTARTERWTVLEPGDTLKIRQGGVVGPCTWHISGTELDGVAP